MEPFIGEVRMVGFNFAPTGWAFCNGQLLSIAQNSALFSILGTTYGGDGVTTFALPNLQGRVPIHWGGTIQLGEAGGASTHTLTATEMPAHTHPLFERRDAATSSQPQGNVVATAPITAATTPNTTLAPASIGASGGSQPHENMQPYLVVNYVIALEGVYPSRG